MMQSCQMMQDVVAQLAAKCGVELCVPGTCLRLVMPHFDPLVIEALHENLVNVAHVYTPQPGVNQADPGIVFFTGYAEWVPIEVTQRIGGYRIYGVLSEDLSDIVSIQTGRQADLAEFGEMWAQNILDQGWLEDGMCESVHGKRKE